MTFSSKSFQSTHPTGRVLWEELLVLSRFHLYLRADEWNFCQLDIIWNHVVALYILYCHKIEGEIRCNGSRLSPCSLCGVWDDFIQNLLKKI